MKHSASRALALLKAMNQRPISSVRDLARDTGISKPSIVRLLAILIEDGYVLRTRQQGSYVLSPSVLELSSGYRPVQRVVVEAAELMEGLTARFDWPTALGIFERDAMVVRYSTIPSSPLSWYQTTLHHHLPLLDYAMGIVYLAHVSQAQRQALLSSIQTEGTTLPALHSEERFEAVRRAGYAVRVPTHDHPTLSISVPIFARDVVIAGLSMTIYGRAMRVEQAVAKFYPELRSVADRVSSRISGLPETDEL